MSQQEKVEELNGILSEIEQKSHTAKILNYDMETACPEGGRQDDGTDITKLQGEIFALEKSEAYSRLVKELYEEKDSLSLYEKRLVTLLHRKQESEECLDSKTEQERDQLFNDAYGIWLKAKKDNSYQEFAPTLEKIARMQKHLLEIRKDYDKEHPYTTLFSDYEYGFTEEDLDKFFEELQEGIVPLLNKVRKASYIPRHDFLNRKVPICRQSKFTTYLLEHNGFDFERGSVSTTEHPFTEQFGENDVRITTKYLENAFISNMFTVIHEGGHALFGQNLTKETFTYHLGDSSLTMAKHESVSRCYENVIGKSLPYISSIYPKFHALFQEQMGDVSEEDFYEGANYIDLENPLRTEADELTYSLHILIRYRMEKEMLSGKADFQNLDKEWNRLYKEILGIDVKDSRTGILQDVHWASGFGYFPTYALGNALNCIYVKKLAKDLPLEKTLKEGNMTAILDWMKKNVFAPAPLMDTKEWIKSITGEEFSAKPYIDYLTKKYTALYRL